MRNPRRAGIRPLSAACAGLLALLGCGSPPPLFESATPADEAFVSTEIPLRFDGGAPILVFHAGGDSIEVVLDTGAARVGVGLSAETIRSLGLESTGGTRTLKTNHGRVRYKRAVVPEARMGGLSYRNLACDQVNAEIHPSSAGRGILGLALLRRFNVLFDYRGSRLLLLRTGLFPADFDSASWKRIPFDDHPDGMMIRGRPDGTPGDLKWCLDTGAIALNPDGKVFYNILKPKHFRGIAGAQEREGRVFTENQTLETGGAPLDSLNFLSFDFREPGGVDGFLGADFFMKNRVLVDFSHAVLWIRKVR